MFHRSRSRRLAVRFPFPKKPIPERGTRVTPRPTILPARSNSTSGGSFARRCSSSSWLTWSEARRAAGATGLPRVTCCTMGRHRSSCSQRNCSDRRPAIVSSDGCGIRPLPLALAFLRFIVEEMLALRIALSWFRISEASALDQLSHLVGLLHRKDHRLLMRRLPLGRCLARGKEMPVVAHVLPHIVAAPRLDINDERDLGLSWVQVKHLFRRDHELNASSGDRTARGDLSREVKLYRVG